MHEKTFYLNIVHPFDKLKLLSKYVRMIVFCFVNAVNDDIIILIFVIGKTDNIRLKLVIIKRGS